MMELEAPDWDKMLSDVNTRLEQMLAAAQARIGDVPEASAPPTSISHDVSASLAQQSQGLKDRLDAAATMLHEVEQSLLAGEELARAHLLQLTGAGRKWAAWPGCAIG